MRNVKKMLMSGLAVGLVVSITVAGTLAYLKAGGDEKTTVTNTFVAAGNGRLIDENTKMFRLTEHVYDNETEKLTDVWVDEADPVKHGNVYENLAPQLILPKDPTLFLDLEPGARAYVFVLVTNNSVRQVTQGTEDTGTGTGGKNPSQIGYGSSLFNIYVDGINNTDWKSALDGADLGVLDEMLEELVNMKRSAPARMQISGLQQAKNPGSGLYYYIGDASQLDADGNPTGVVVGKDVIDINGSTILKGLKEGDTGYKPAKTWENGIVRTAETLGDADPNEEGMQLGELKFQAFACQAQGFDSPLEAFVKCFPEEAQKIFNKSSNDDLVNGKR